MTDYMIIYGTYFSALHSLLQCMLYVNNSHCICFFIVAVRYIIALLSPTETVDSPTVA